MGTNPSTGTGAKPWLTGWDSSFSWLCCNPDSFLSTKWKHAPSWKSVFGSCVFTAILWSYWWERLQEWLLEEDGPPGSCQSSCCLTKGLQKFLSATTSPSLRVTCFYTQQITTFTCNITKCFLSSQITMQAGFLLPVVWILHYISKTIK